MRIDSIHKQGIRSINEDTLLCDDANGIFGVFDGASPLTNFRTDSGETGGYLASQCAAQIFHDFPGSLLEKGIESNDAINKLAMGYKIDTTEAKDRFSTAAAVFHVTEKYIDLFQIGDCIIIVKYSDGSCNVPLGYNDQDLETMKHWKRLNQEGKSNVRELLSQVVIDRRNAANTDYGNLNGDDKARKHMQTTRLERSNVQAVIALTDGLMLPKQDPESPDDWTYHVELVMKKGLAGLYEYAHRLEASDPNLVLYPRFKLHDDATGVGVFFDQ